MSVRVALAFIITIVLAPSISAEDLTVILTNGTVFKGSLISENDNFIALNTGGTNIKVLKSIIATINGNPYQQGESVSALPVQTKAAEPAQAPANQPQPAQPAQLAQPAQPAPAKPGSMLPGTQHTVTLKNGTKFTGTLLTENVNFMTFKINISKVNILKSIVADVDGLPYSPAGIVGQPAAAAPSAPAAPAAPTPSAQPATAANQTKAEPSAAQKAEPAAPIKPAEQPKAAVASPALLPAAPAPAAVAAPEKPKVAPVKQDTTIKTKPTESGKPKAEVKPSLEPSAKPGPATAKPDTTAKAAVSTEPEKPKAESKPVQEASPRPAAIASADTAKKPGAQPSAAAGGKPVQPQAAATGQKPSSTPQTPGSPGYGPMAPLPVTKQKPASEWSAQPQAGTVKSAGADTATDIVKQTGPPIRDGAITLNMPSFNSIDKAIQDAGASETYRRMAMAIHAESHAAEATPAIPKLIELLGDSTRFNPSKKEIKAFNADTLAKFTPALLARKALGAIGEPAVKPLIEALSIRSFTVRAHSAWLLGEIKDPRAVESLLAAVKDSSYIVRAKASEALGKIRDPRSIPLLLTLLEQDTSGAVKTATQTALKNLTDIPTLIKGLEDPHVIVRDNAAYILFLMTAQDFRSDPSQWETWWKNKQEQPADTSAKTQQIDKKEKAKTAEKKAVQKKK